jgi:glycosyltransferase involved in cell wall biosynthesis
VSKKKILIHSIVFNPDGVSTAYLYNDIALRFKAEEYDVEVLTTTPHYNVLEEERARQPLKARLAGLYYTSDFHGIKVIHVPQKKYKSTLLRMLGFVYWHFLSFVIMLFKKKISVILSPSPPLTIGIINIIAAKLKGCKVIYNVQEIYPDFLIQQKELKSGFIIKFLSWLERFVYNNSDAVTTIDAIFYNTIVNRFKDPSKLHIISNFVDTDLYKPIDKAQLKLNTELFPDNPSVLKLMYAGNIGFAQDWDPLIAVAKALRDSPVEFFIAGEGAMKNSLSEQISEQGLAKVHLLPYQSRELMPSLIGYADLHFIFMTNEMEKHGFPSKVYTIMACAKPMLISSGKDTPIVNFLEPYNCAFISTAKDFSEKCKTLENFIRQAIVNSGILSEMGYRGYDEVIHQYSKQAVTSQYLTLANTILQNE